MLLRFPLKCVTTAMLKQPKAASLCEEEIQGDFTTKVIKD